MKTLDVGLPVTNFEDQPMELEGQPLTIKTVLLAYCAQAGQLGLDAVKQGCAFEAGLAVAQGGVVALAPNQYDVLKELADRGGLFNTLVSQRVKRAVDNAPTQHNAPTQEA